MHALEKPEQPSVHCSCVTSWQAHHSEVGNDCTQNRKVYMSKTEDNFCVKSLWKKGTYFMGNGHDSQVDLTSLHVLEENFDNSNQQTLPCMLFISCLSHVEIVSALLLGSTFRLRIFLLKVSVMP